MWAALVSGAVIGLLSGLTGTGGAIFLTPLMLFKGWAEPKRAAAVSALFVLLNSAAGLAGFMTSNTALPNYIAPMLRQLRWAAPLVRTWAAAGFNPLPSKSCWQLCC